MPFRTIVSTDCGAYLHWQMQMLVESYHRVQQPGPLTRLVAATSAATIRELPGVETVVTRAYCPDPETGDHYLPYNKPGSIGDWLMTSPGDDDEIVLLIDSDFVFFDRCVRYPEPGRPIAETIWYMEPHLPDSRYVLQRYCRVSPDKVQAPAVPTFIRKSDLRVIAPRWLEVTRQMRADRDMPKSIEWICEMWGYSIAAAEAGLVHQFERLSNFQPEKQLTLPMVHYCYHSESADKSWFWNKHQYQAWSKPTPCPADTDEIGRRLYELVDEMAAKHGYQIIT